MRNNRDIDIILGDAIRDARTRKDLSLQDVCDRMGNAITKMALSNYENANRSMSMEVFIKICKVLDVDYRSLMDEIYRSL